MWSLLVLVSSFHVFYFLRGSPLKNLTQHSFLLHYGLHDVAVLLCGPASACSLRSFGELMLGTDFLLSKFA